MKGVIKMTVKTELERLKKQKEELEQDRRKLQEALKGLLSQETVLQRKGEELSPKKSSLAQTLQAKNQKELEEKQQEIAVKRAEVEELMQELQEIQAGIDERENDPALYIQEQVHLMVPQFLEWVAKNKEAIGYDIKRSFRVGGVTRREVSINKVYYYPIGNMGIFEDKQKTNEEPIVCSRDFYFQQSCYVAEVDEEGNIIAKLTDWYTTYARNFIEVLLKELEASYNLGEELELTIISPDFTLELV